MPPNEASSKPKKSRADHLKQYRIRKGQVLNPIGRPTGWQQIHDAVTDFIFESGQIEDKAGKKHPAFKILMQGWVMKAREDIEFARFLLALLVGKQADGNVPGLEGQGKTLIRRERLLEIFREAAGENMKLIDAQVTSAVTKEGNNGDGGVPAP